MNDAAKPRNAIHVLGWAALAATLALSSPGVTIARAADPVDVSSELERFQQFHADSSQDTGETDLGGACSAAVDSAAQQLAAADALLQVQKQLAARAQEVQEAGGDPSQGIVVLNGRGANYGSGSDPNFDMRGVQLEQLGR